MHVCALLASCPTLSETSYGFITNNNASLTTIFNTVLSSKGSLKVQGQALDIANAMDVLPSPPDMTSIATLIIDGSVYTGNSSLNRRRMQSYETTSSSNLSTAWDNALLDDALKAADAPDEFPDIKVQGRQILQSATDTATVIASITTVAATLNSLLANLQISATLSLLNGTYLDWRSFTTQVAQVRG